MRAEYDLKSLKGSRPNPYAKRLGAAGRKALIARFYAAEQLVRLDDDIAEFFPDAATVNETLRLALQMKGVLAKAKARRAKSPRAKKSA